jgi:hypothetical protein
MGGKNPDALMNGLNLSHSCAAAPRIEKTVQAGRHEALYATTL